MPKVKTMTQKQLAERIVAKLRSDLELDDNQICAALAAAAQALSRMPYCHIHFDSDGSYAVCEVLDAETFAHEHVGAIDKGMLNGLKQYEAAGMTKYVLFSSPHASMLSALPGRK